MRVLFGVLAVLGLLGVFPVAAQERPVVVVTSARDFAMTVSGFKAALEKRGVTLVAEIDHAANAVKVGAVLPPTTMLVFANPKLGTPLIVANRGVALDLPLRALVAAEGSTVTVTYEDPSATAKRHGLDGAEAAKTMSGALKAIVAEATAAP